MRLRFDLARYGGSVSWPEREEEKKVFFFLQQLNRRGVREREAS